MQDAAINRWIIDSATDFAIVATDTDGRVTTWNEGARRILGWLEADMLGQRIDRIFTPEDIATDRPQIEMRRALEYGAGNDERWHIRKDGERFWANGEMTPLLNDAGAVMGFVKVLRDRNEQRLAAEALREAEADTRLLLDSMAEGFYAVDRDGVTTECNAAFLRMMGFSRKEDAVGRKLHGVIHHSHRDGRHYERTDCPIYTCARVGRRAHVIDELFFPVDGDPLPVEYWAIPIIRDGRIDGAICTFLDISERVAADVARHASETRLRELNTDLERQVVERVGERALTWSVSSELLSVIDLKTGLFERVNPAWQHTLGWSAEHMEGVHYSAFVSSEDMGASAEELARLAAGNPLLRFENRYRMNTGDWRWLSWVAVPYNGKLYSSARDVTAERQRLRDLERAEDALRQAQKMEAVGQLTGGVAHDFNNLLTVIRGSVDLLRRPDLPPERRERYVDAIGETADRAAALTGQLLAFARRQALKPEIFDAGASILEVASMVRTLTGARIVLETRAPPEPCMVLSDRSQFDTAIVNMSINARDAMGGEGKLSIAVGPVSGIPALRSHPPITGDFVAVAITDTGTGIAEDEIARIFEPFFTTKQPGQGTGLGLSQVFGFAKQSDGDIRVESKVGQGTTFTLYMPRVMDGSPEPVPKPDLCAAVDGKGICVLVVEDNKAVGAFATQALSELGYDSVFASDAAQAMVELERDCSRFHIVFSDVVMPGTSGLELGRQIRHLYPTIPVILTSGYSHVLAQNGNHGFELLHKPYSIEQLSRVLRKAIAWQTKER